MYWWVVWAVAGGFVVTAVLMAVGAVILSGRISEAERRGARRE